jgi:hypothetical protein
MARAILTAALVSAGCLLMAQGAAASTLYDNGAPSGSNGAASIAYGSELADSFTLSATSTITGIDFASWDYPTTTLNAVGYAIESTPQVPANLTTATLTSSYLFTQANGYNVDNNAFSVTPQQLSAGTYYLVLGEAAGGGGGFWDENDGPSTSYGPFGQLSGSESFRVLGSTVSAAPEPAAWLLMIAGLAGVGLTLRQARRRAVLA